MSLSFNVTGPCVAGDHYMVPPERRLASTMALIEQEKYFTLTGGRQTGKTTSLLWLARHLDATGRHRAVCVDIQAAREKSDPKIALPILLEKLDLAVSRQLPDIGPCASAARFREVPATAVRNYLADLAARSPLPVVVFFDAADGLVGEAMVSFLTQLRDGYLARHESPFPASVALVGMRAVRDYTLSANERAALPWLGARSPFHTADDALALACFTRDDVVQLLAEHTAATGQLFEPAAVERIWHLTQGHPWLVNALADQIAARDLKDPGIPITEAHVASAKETIILERRTNIDSLIARLREPRVRRILDPMLAAQALPPEAVDEDLSYVTGLGLVRDVGGSVEVANPIYREVIPRALSFTQQTGIRVDDRRFVRPDGTLDVRLLMTEWQAYWRRDGHLAAQGISYRESGPHLMMMAFLQRVVNGSGRIDPEYGFRRGAVDILVEWRTERHVIELKLRRDTETEIEAFSQLAGHLDTVGLQKGWLVLFDLRSTLPWEERLFQKTVSLSGKTLHVIGA